jgi:hypothetical protein
MQQDCMELYSIGKCYHANTNMALPRIEWVDYRMGHARQRAVYTDIGYPFSVEGG